VSHSREAAAAASVNSANAIAENSFKRLRRLRAEPGGEALLLVNGLVVRPLRSLSHVPMPLNVRSRNTGSR